MHDAKKIMCKIKITEPQEKVNTGIKILKTGMQIK